MMFHPVQFLVVLAALRTTNAEDWESTVSALTSPLSVMLLLGGLFALLFLCWFCCRTRCSSAASGFETFDNDDDKKRPRKPGNSNGLVFWNKKGGSRGKAGPAYTSHQTHVTIQPIVHQKLASERSRHQRSYSGSAYSLNSSQDGCIGVQPFGIGSTYIPQAQPAPPAYERF